MELATLFFIPSRFYNCGYLAVAEEPEGALEVFKECWVEVTFREDRRRNITLKDVKEWDKRILNTNAGLIDVKIANYFEKPAFFGRLEAVGINEIPTIFLSGEAWEVFSSDYNIECDDSVFKAYDSLSGIKIRVDQLTETGYYVIWMNTNKTDTEYNVVLKKSAEEAIDLALSILRKAKTLREAYRKQIEEERQRVNLRRAQTRWKGLYKLDYT